MASLPNAPAKSRTPRKFPPLVWDGTAVDPSQVCSAGTWHVQRPGGALHRHLILELLWNEAPMRLRLLDRCVLLRQPTVAILPAGTLHIAEPAGARFSRRKIGRDLSIREDVLHGQGGRLELRTAILPPRHVKLVLPLLRHLHARMNAAAPPASHDQCDMLAGLCGLLRDLGYATPQAAPVSKGAIERALDLLYARHADPSLRMKDLAKAAGMSESHFRRVFAERTGSPPQRLLAKLRRFHALRLMEMRHMKAATVAAEVGFGSVSAMYKQLNRQRPRAEGSPHS